MKAHLKSLVLAAFTATSAATAAGGSVTGKVEVTPAKYLEETVVYLKGPAGAPPSAQTKSMDQQNMTFIPHILVITLGDTVKFLNHDNLVHNVYSPDNEGFNLGSFKQGEERSYKFKQEGAYTQLCSLHPEMLAFIFVAPTPYVAVVDKKGNYTLANVPPGTYQLAVWNSHLKAPDRSITVTAGPAVTQNLTLKR